MSMLTILTACAARQVRWFQSNLTETLEMVHEPRSSLTGVYPGLHAGSTFDNGSFAPQPLGPGADRRAALPCDIDGHATGVYAWTAALLPLGLTVEPVIDVSPIALLNGTAGRAIPALVACARATNITGYMLDFESYGPWAHTLAPGQGAAQLAATYTSWLHALGDALHAAGKTLAVCISDYGVLGEYAAGYADPRIDTLMTMATYYNMAPASKNCSICPLHAWEDRRYLWAQWLLLPQAVGARPAALSAGVGQVTSRGCGCENGTAGCCDFIPSPLTDKAPAAQPSNYPPGQPAGSSADGCHGLGCSGNCFFWTEADLADFVQWCAEVARVGSIDIYRADFNARGDRSWRTTAAWYFPLLEAFLNGSTGSATRRPAPVSAS